MAKDTFYFSHDYNSRNDSKIKKLLAKYGYEGYGLFWAIIEDLYNNTNVLRLDYDTISFDLRSTPEIVKSLIHDFDLFEIDKECFGSLSVQRRLNERNAKSKKARESVLSRWNKSKSHTNVLQTNNDSNTIKESIVKESIVNEIIKVGGTKKVPLPPNPVFVECKRFWLNDFKQGWTFTGAKGKALKSIITKIKTACKNSGNEITDILLTETFKMICLRLPEFFKNKDLEIIDQKFNEIITEIKQLQNGNITTKDSNGKPISKYHN